MRLLDLTLTTPIENVALDEALLEEAEAADQPAEVLRLWEPAELMVVVGRSSDMATEVRLEACRQNNVSVVRRISGGAAVVGGPGCLMYALVLSYTLRPALRNLDAAHRFVLETLIRGLSRLAPGIQRRGTSDLAIGERKVSGNSVRLKRTHLLYHGTLLYDFEPALVARYLAEPPRQPDYREGRPHEAFVTNLPADAASLRRALASAWSAHKSTAVWPERRVRELAADKYRAADWSLRH